MASPRTGKILRERHAAFKRAIRAAQQRYRSHRNVVGVSGGTKFVGGKPVDDDHSIHFYVSRKTRSRAKTKRPLPAFVYGRRADGSVDRRYRFKTDVIHVGKPELACGAGSQIKHMGDGGVATLIFRNKRVAGDDHYYLITCAHVAGSFTESPPFDKDLDSPPCCDTSPFAVTIVNSTHSNLSLSYDVALARITDPCSPQSDLAIASGGRLQGFLKRGKIRPGLRVRCELPISLHREATVGSYEGVVEVDFEGSTYSVGNAYLMQANVDRGDSGGLLHAEGLGVGIVFARSPMGWGWFHPVGDAARFVFAKAGIPLNPL